MDDATFERMAARLAAGEPWSDRDVTMLSDTRHLVRLGALADQDRRARVGDRVTFVRVHEAPWSADPAQLAPPDPAGEVRLTGRPGSLDEAVEAVERAVARAGDTPVTGFALGDLVRLSGEEASRFERGLRRLRAAGLAAVSEVVVDRPLDAVWLRRAAEADVMIARATVHDPSAGGAVAVDRVRAWGAAVPVRAFAPLPCRLPESPSTGYEDVRRVALARLLVDNIRSIQVDWRLYGPKLAQVALTFGADDVDRVAPTDSLDRGRRRTALAEVRQNIVAAALTPVQRNGRFETLGPVGN